MPRPASKGNIALWHAHIGYPDPISLHKLGRNCLGVELRGLSVTECSSCAQAKIKWQISQRPSNHVLTTPCQEIHVDWTDLEKAYDEFVRVMFIINRFLDFIFPYFMLTHGQENENLHVFKDFVNWMKGKFGLKIEVIKFDNKMSRKKILCWLYIKYIKFESSASRI